MLSQRNIQITILLIFDLFIYLFTLYIMDTAVINTSTSPNLDPLSLGQTNSLAQTLKNSAAANAGPFVNQRQFNQAYNELNQLLKNIETELSTIGKKSKIKSDTGNRNDKSSKDSGSDSAKDKDEKPKAQKVEMIRVDIDGAIVFELVTSTGQVLNKGALDALKQMLEGIDKDLTLELQEAKQMTGLLKSALQDLGPHVSPSETMKQQAPMTTAQAGFKNYA